MIIANHSDPVRTHGGLQRLLSLGGGGGSVISALDFYCMELGCLHLHIHISVLLVKHKAVNFYSVIELR